MPESSPSEPTHVPTGTEPVVAVSMPPAMRPPRWSGKKTAVMAALAISVAAAGTVGAAAAVPQGAGADAGFRPGRMGTGQLQPGQGPGQQRWMQQGQQGQPMQPGQP